MIWKKHKENVINRKFYEFDLYSWKYQKTLSHSWNKYHIQRQTIDYPLYLHLITIEILFLR